MILAVQNILLLILGLNKMHYDHFKVFPLFDLEPRRFNFRYAMKCLDKKRIKMKGGETLALNERIMLSLVSTGVSDDGAGN